MRPAAALPLGALLLSTLLGCGATVYTDVAYTSGQRSTPKAGRDLPAAGDEKAAVLARLGPPGEVLPTATGDVFVYRLREIDRQLVQLNAGLFVPLAVPLWARGTGLRADEVLFVFFDAGGIVRHLASSYGDG